MCTDKQYESLVEKLENFTGNLIKKYDIGSVAAALQDLAADCLAECEDTDVRDAGIKNFAWRVENCHVNHKIERVGE